MLLTAVLVVSLAPSMAQADEDSGDPVAQHNHTPPSAAPAATAVEPAPAQSSSTAAPASPSAPTATLVGTDAAKSKKKKPFSVGVSVGHSVGSGTFTFKDYNSLVTGSLNVSPSYSFQVGTQKMSVSASAGLSYEYTTPDNSLARPYGWSDLGLGLSIPSFYKDKWSGITFSANAGAFIPTTLENWWGNVATGLSAGISMSRPVGKVNLSGRFGASKTIYTSLDRKLDENVAGFRSAEGHLLYICREDPNGCLLRGGNPTLWAMSGGVSASYSPVEKLGLSIGFNMGKSYAYVIGIDEFSSRAVDSNGNPVVDAQGIRDNMAGSIGASYQLTESIGMSFGMGTGLSPKTPDNKAFQFPFFAFNGWQASRTSFSLSFSGSY